MFKDFLMLKLLLYGSSIIDFNGDSLKNFLALHLLLVLGRRQRHAN